MTAAYSRSSLALRCPTRGAPIPLDGALGRRAARAFSASEKPFEFEKEADDPFGLDAFLHKAKQASSSKRKDDDGRDRRDDR